MDTLIASTKLLLLIFTLIPQAPISFAQSCSKYKFTNNLKFDLCTDLPVLEAQLHWNYIPSTKTAHIAYRAAQSSTGWVAWGINPSGSDMVGSQALVAFRRSDGQITAYPTPISDRNPSMEQGSLSFRVSNISAEYDSGAMTIFAVVGPLDDWTSVNLVWQAGDSVLNNVPQPHQMSGPNVQSMATLDFVSG